MYTKIHLYKGMFKKGHKLSPESIAKRTAKNTGKKRSDSFREKMSRIRKGMKFSDEHRKNMSLSRKGKHLSPDTEFKKGMKISKRSLELRSGENSRFWLGGISNEEYTEVWTDTLRESIRQRDDYTCQLCGIHQDELVGRFKVLDVHHIDYVKENCDPVNLVSLCRPCHAKTNSNREYWLNYFSQL